MCFAVGLCIVSCMMPDMREAKAYDVTGRCRRRNPFFVVFPAAFVSGTLLMTWALYALAWMFSKAAPNPLLHANAILLVAVLYVLVCLRKRLGIRKLLRSMRFTRGEVYFITFAFGISLIVMLASFRVVRGEVCIGAPVTGDFSVHISMIRSFSRMQNVPADYPLFAGSDLKYHFMFDFLVGNLEFLGMRIDHAFNVPSILSMMSMLFALYAVALRISGNCLAAALAGVFAMLRSSLGLFTQLRSEEFSSVEQFLENRTYVGSAPLESWGIYGLNTFINQRHLCFGFAVALVVIYMFLEFLREGVANLRLLTGKKERRPEHPLRYWWTHDAFPVDNKGIRYGLFASALLGMNTYFHGPSTISALLVLFVLAFASGHKMTFLFTAAVTVVLAYVQLEFFAAGGETFAVTWRPGWILENSGIREYIDFFVCVIGILSILVLFYLVTAKVEKKIAVLSMFLPLLFAFTIQMTPDINQNHKYILFTFMLLSVCSGELIARLYIKGKALLRSGVGIVYLSVAVAFSVLLTATGTYDFLTLLNKCKWDYAYHIPVEEDFAHWAETAGVDNDTLFLCGGNYLSPLTFAGVEIYLGHSLFPWSAGYDVAERLEWEKAIYSATNREHLRTLANAIGVDYIVINRTVRLRGEGYQVNEDLFEETFPISYRTDEGEWMFTVYRVEEE